MVMITTAHQQDDNDTIPTHGRADDEGGNGEGGEIGKEDGRRER